MLQTTCIGHLGGDAVTKNENGKEFSVFRIADTQKWTDDAGQTHEETTWVDCVMNGKPAVLPYLKKGQQVFVSGSTKLRVYSSAKDRCMKAGLTINVRQVELLGAKSDDVPSLLYTEDGKNEVKVNKWYNAVSMQRDATQLEQIVLVSRSGERYLADRQGWLTKEQPTPPTE